MLPAALVPRLRKQLRRLRRPALHRTRQKELSERRLVLSARPAHVSLELTSRCNLECVHCRRFHVREEASAVRGVYGEGEVTNVVGDSGYLSPRVFERVIDLVRDADTVELAGYGEPMMNPHFFDYVARLKARGHHLNTITNGTLLTDANVKQLVDHRFDLVSVSVDGYERDTLAVVRGLDRDKLFAGLERLQAEKARRGLGRDAPPRLSVSMVMARFNVREMPALVRHLDGLGLWSFYAQNLEVVNAADVLGPQLVYTDPAVRAETVAIVREVEEYCAAHGIRTDIQPIPHAGHGWEPPGPPLSLALDVLKGAMGPRPTERKYLPLAEIEARQGQAAARYAQAQAEAAVPRGVLPPVETAELQRLGAAAREENARCLDFFRYAFVAWNGKVLSCCFERYPVGDLNVAGADEVWNGAEYRRLRRAYHEQGIRSVCDGCSKILA
jgi:MoaA/NifB/PqqE/SkfB family radical SAM enzyme